MAKDSRTILARGFRKLEEPKTYVLAFISVKKLGDPWRSFTKIFLRKLSEAQGSNIDLDMLVEKAYEYALKNNGWNAYDSLGLQGSYLYPTVEFVNYKAKESLLENAILNQNLVDVIYSSNKLSATGESRKIKRLYVGRVHEYNNGRDLLTLKIQDTYRSFKLSKILTVDDFTKSFSHVEVKHLKIELRPLSSGGTEILWREIIGEDDELIAKPWEGPLKREKIFKETATASEEPVELEASPTHSEKESPFNHLRAENLLAELYDEFITVTVGSGKSLQRASFVLKGFLLNGDSPKAVLYGDGGIQLAVYLDSAKILLKGEANPVSFKTS